MTLAAGPPASLPIFIPQPSACWTLQHCQHGWIRTSRGKVSLTRPHPASPCFLYPLPSTASRILIRIRRGLPPLARLLTVPPLLAALGRSLVCLSSINCLAPGSFLILASCQWQGLSFQMAVCACCQVLPGLIQPWACADPTAVDSVDFPPAQPTRHRIASSFGCLYGLWGGPESNRRVTHDHISDNELRSTN